MLGMQRKFLEKQKKTVTNRGIIMSQERGEVKK